LLKAKTGKMKPFSSSAYRPKVDAGPQQIQMNQCGSKRSQEEELDEMILTCSLEGVKKLV